MTYTKRQGMFWVTYRVIHNGTDQVVAFQPTEESGYSTGKPSWAK